jgi:hypothetical protein
MKNGRSDRESPTFVAPQSDQDFGQCASLAADLLIALRQLEGERLSAKAFRKAAMQAAGIDDAELARARQAVADDKIGALEWFVRKLSVPIAAGHIGEVPGPKLAGKLERAYGSVEASLAMARERIGPLAIFALAAERAAAIHPEAFGTCSHAAERGKRLAEWRGLLAQYFAAMRERYSTSDLVIGGPPPVDGDVRVPHGYVRVAFKIAPGVCPDDPDWPRLVAEALVRQGGMGERLAARPVRRRKSEVPLAQEAGA